MRNNQIVIQKREWMVFNASDTGFALLIPLRFAATSVGECPSGIWDISVLEKGMAKLEGQKGRNV